MLRDAGVPSLDDEGVSSGGLGRSGANRSYDVEAVDSAGEACPLPRLVLATGERAPPPPEPIRLSIRRSEPPDAWPCEPPGELTWLMFERCVGELGVDSSDSSPTSTDCSRPGPPEGARAATAAMRPVEAQQFGRVATVGQRASEAGRATRCCRRMLMRLSASNVHAAEAPSRQ